MPNFNQPPNSNGFEVREAKSRSLQDLNTQLIELRNNNENFGGKDLLVNVPLSDITDSLGIQEYQTDKTDEDGELRNAMGVPLFHIETGGKEVGEYVTYTVLAEKREDSLTGKFHIVGRDSSGSQIDFTVLGDKENHDYRVNLGRGFRNGKEVDKPDTSIPDTVSREHVGLAFLYDNKSDKAQIMISDTSKNGSRVYGSKNVSDQNISSENGNKDKNPSVIKSIGRWALRGFRK